MSTETKLRPPFSDELKGFKTETKDGVYFIVRNDLVWFEPVDSEPHYIEHDDYPLAIIDEFERRLRAKAAPKFIDTLRNLTKDRIVYYNLGKEKSAQDFYEFHLKGALRTAAESRGGVNLLALHLTLSNEDACTFPAEIADDLKALLKEEGFRLNVSNTLSREGAGLSSVYIDWIISW